ncbi:hypothetical protein HH1059_04490 [Halorhodospira halochloris]|uniref:Uncharacterized protein n=1 Tax=Halorhodospira halochloris TaxID=1052 RepID=A0A0X8X7W4_HALHR|nr:hypothetical protein [Halorhodospira halochloris]MBK1652923.1 hypothetical protein [Halorhodospira halochloris]BAU57124.1 hypothetical protein HH1059_04490 [Halorhodospira halochloris]
MNILIYGFGFSGSGALIDAFKDTEQIAIAPKISGLSGDGGVGALLTAADDRQRQREIAQVRLKELESKIAKERRARRWTWWYRLQERRRALSRALGLRRGGVHASQAERESIEEWLIDARYLQQFLAEIDAGKQLDMVAYWRQWLQERLFANAPGAQWVLVDKRVPLMDPKMDGIWQPLYEPFKLVVVHRDPADHMAEIVRQKGWKKVARQDRDGAREGHPGQRCEAFAVRAGGRQKTGAGPSL